ncbi:hypothetical protein CEXT_149361 [Caerostris extrusa]|uniref:Uncharacterized protein n=1 Tax=Caerostris extrusa TaxID=172846 RepID=A0AAV4NLW2_CAEEX|nr:hypothetical protein CEXT_149361 [Caerostris extrusa]
MVTVYVLYLILFSIFPVCFCDGDFMEECAEQEICHTLLPEKGIFQDFQRLGLLQDNLSSLKRTFPAGPATASVESRVKTAYNCNLPLLRYGYNHGNISRKINKQNYRSRICRRRVHGHSENEGWILPLTRSGKRLYEKAHSTNAELTDMHLWHVMS